jgi:hypothetical protein
LDPFRIYRKSHIKIDGDYQKDMLVEATMHITFTKVRSGKKYKRYVRLVQSFRRPDGMPAQKVIANLGELSDREVANLRVALAANRKGKAVVVERQEKRHVPEAGG